MGKSSGGADTGNASLPEYTRALVPDPRAFLNAEIIIVEPSGSRAIWYSNGASWVGGGGTSSASDTGSISGGTTLTAATIYYHDTWVVNGGGTVTLAADLASSGRKLAFVPGVGQPDFTIALASGPTVIQDPGTTLSSAEADARTVIVFCQSDAVWRVESATNLSILDALARTPTIPSAVAGSVSSAYLGGATPWQRLYGPNEFRTTWGASAEWSTAVSYVTAASAANGPAMFRREGASMLIDFSKPTQTYGNYRITAAGLAANTFANKPVAVLVYIHRMHPNMGIRLRVGVDTGNYIYYQFSSANGLLVEGWNQLLCHTSEPIGVGSSANGQQSFQTGGILNDGWYVGAGAFNPNTNVATINYLAVEFTNYCTAVGNSRSYAWVEGIYIGGKDKPRVTIGFDIQTAGLDGAKSTMDAYGLVGYAAVPTANGAPANPQALWVAGDVSRLQALYADGWDIVQHSVSHNSLGTLADESAIAAELEACRSQIVAAGMPGAVDLHATPNNSYSNRLISVMAKTGVLWARHGINAPLLVPRGLVGLANPLMQGAISMANQLDAVRTLAFVDLAILYGASVHLYTHDVSASPTAVGTNIAVFDAICAGLRSRINAGQIEVVTPSAFIRDCAPPTSAAILATPSRLSLTPGASPFDLFNTGYAPLRFVISGGTVTQISYSRDGITFDVTGQTSGDFEVNPGDRLRITYSAAPTIIQYSV